MSMYSMATSPAVQADQNRRPLDRCILLPNHTSAVQAVGRLGPWSLQAIAAFASGLFFWWGMVRIEGWRPRAWAVVAVAQVEPREGDQGGSATMVR